MDGTASHPAVTPDAVEIWFKIEKDAEGFPESQDWEELWATPIQGDTFRLDNTPFFVKDIAAGDVVSAVKTEAGFLRIREDYLPKRKQLLFGSGCAMLRRTTL
jgi:hypothetical protein